ncbi:MAG: lysozyme [Rhodobacterales bacterium]|nr:lysozyme [Rhodobacterales bacterium]
MTDMTISTRGLLEIAEHEGIVPAPYLDSVGVWTWGIGHTVAAGGPDPAKMHRAMPQDIDKAVIAAIEQFAVDVKGYVARVNEAIHVPLAQHQFDALVSFDFNTGGIHRAKLTAAINAGEPDAAQHFMGWLRPPEIRKRRTAEMSLFRTGDYAANGDAIPIWRTDGNGKLAGSLRSISGEEVLRRIASAPIPAELPKMVDLELAIAAAARVRAAQDTASRALAELEAALAA